MDDRLPLFLWTLAGALAFALLGGLFGALAGWMCWRSGSASGSIVARRVAEALARLLPDEPSDGQLAALTGAADGALFLGAAGTLAGLLAGQVGSPADWLVPGFGILLLLMLGAVVFGILAYALVRLGAQAILSVFVGGMGGALLTAGYVGVTHIVPGAVAGIILGVLTSFALPRSR
jgi:hypothetical protein